jgi:mannose-6-phosphate isomerase-like protein (cupin superfamily)
VIARGDSVAYSDAMRRERISGKPKGWFFGPWNSDLPFSGGFANAAIDEPHTHSRVTEIYLVARGSCSIRVETETIELSEGDALVIDPGDAHTFLTNSEDYLHLVIHTPGLAGDHAAKDKRAVARSRLGL